MKHTTKSPDETYDLAVRYASSLKPGDILLLIGNLGAGKTCFVQGLAFGLDVPDGVYVRSPTFALVNEYLGGKVPIYHFDFYRLDDASALGDLGLDEYLYGDGIAVIEWADKFSESLPVDAIKLTFEIIDENTRHIVIENSPPL